MLENPQGSVLGILHNPWPTKPASGRLLGAYRKALLFKANPRDDEYMTALFYERFPNGILGGETRSADSIVLLYSDAIGLGWGSTEREIFRSKKAGAGVRVLNGRRREFILDQSTLFSLKIRRVLETTMMGEAGATVFFVAVTPLLLIADWARGRV